MNEDELIKKSNKFDIPLIGTNNIKFGEIDEFSAHETGVFHYYTINKKGQQSDTYVHFESLWVKKNNKWKMIMEYQKSRTTEAEWNTL